MYKQNTEKTNVTDKTCAARQDRFFDSQTKYTRLEGKYQVFLLKISKGLSYTVDRNIFLRAVPDKGSLFPAPPCHAIASGGGTPTLFKIL
jgi:hypothetical protein